VNEVIDSVMLEKIELKWDGIKIIFKLSNEDWAEQ